MSAGTVVNVASDFYKAGAKAAGAGLVKGGPFRLAVRLNYLGDIVRYSGFAVASGHPAAFILPLFVAFTNISTVTGKQIESQKSRYGDEFLEVCACFLTSWMLAPHLQCVSFAPQLNTAWLLLQYASKTPMLVPFTWPMLSAKDAKQTAKAE